MSDNVAAPSVKNELRQGKFTLIVMAYRPITKSEIMAVAAQWLKSHNRKSFPASGTATVITAIGLNS